MTTAASGKLGAILFLMVGVSALVIGIWQGVQTERFLARAVAATGHVVAVPGQASRTMTSAHPTVEFTSASGAVVHYRQDGMGARLVGEVVDLLYDPASPNDSAVVRSFWTQWFPTVAPIVLGLAFLAAPMLGFSIGMRGARP